MAKAVPRFDSWGTECAAGDLDGSVRWTCVLRRLDCVPPRTGTGVLLTRDRASEPPSSVSPLIGRVYSGVRLSRLLAEMEGAEVREEAGRVVVTGAWSGRNLRIGFDPNRDWLAVEGGMTGPAGGSGSWLISEFVEANGHWFPSLAQSSTSAPGPVGTRTTTYRFGGLKTRPAAEAIVYPPPRDRTIISGPDSMTYFMRPDGQLDLAFDRKPPGKPLLGWNQAFVLASATLLVVSAWWAVVSRRRRSSAA